MVETPRLGPQLRAGRGDPVAALHHTLVADNDRAVMTGDEAIAFKPGHQLIESGGRSPHAVLCQRLTHDTSRLLAAMKDAEHEELQVCEIRDAVRHNATLYTVV